MRRTGRTVLTGARGAGTVDPRTGHHPSGGPGVELLPPTRVGCRLLPSRRPVCAGRRRRRRPRGLGRELPRRSHLRRTGFDLRQGDPRREPRHALRQPGPVRAAVAAARLVHAARGRQRARAFGRPARHGAAEPRLALHPEPDAGGREAAAGHAGVGRGEEPPRVGLAHAAQAALGAGDGDGQGGRHRARGRPARADAQHADGRVPAPDAARGRPGGRHGRARRDVRRGGAQPGDPRRPRRRRRAPPFRPPRRRRHVEPRRPRGRERGPRVAHGRRVRAAAGGVSRDQGRRGLRSGRHEHARRRRPRAARPHGGRALRPGHVARERPAHGDGGRALHLHRLPARRAPR